MSCRIAVFSFAVALLAQSAARAQSCTLSEDDLADQCFRIQLTMELSGKMTVRQDGKPLSLSQTARATHDFLERVLLSKGGVASKTARFYEEGKVVLKRGDQLFKSGLEPGLLVAHRVKDHTVVYHPRRPLTQEELEITEHFDTLHLGGLLPGKETKVGASWKVTSDIVQALCAFDGLVEHDLTGTLEDAKGDIAHLRFVGKARGIDAGAEVNLVVDARADFDLKRKRLTRLSWKQSDQREQGPVSPALSADVLIELTRTPIEQPAKLNNIALVPVPEGLPPDNLTALHYRDAKKRFRFAHGRDWRVVGVKDEQVVLRLLDRGDFVAQATLTPWKKAAPADMLTLEEFAKLMASAPGWTEEKRIETTDKVEGPSGVRVFRVSAEGTLDGVNAVQFFYLLGGPKGEQMIVTFTMTPGQVSKLDARDLTLLRSIRLESMLKDDETARGE